MVAGFVAGDFLGGVTRRKRYASSRTNTRRKPMSGPSPESLVAKVVVVIVEKRVDGMPLHRQIWRLQGYHGPFAFAWCSLLVLSVRHVVLVSTGELTHGWKSKVCLREAVVDFLSRE